MDRNANNVVWFVDLIIDTCSEEYLIHWLIMSDDETLYFLSEKFLELFDRTWKIMQNFYSIYLELDDKITTETFLSTKTCSFLFRI